ncbi:MAG: hypothetical protein FWE22_01760 [Firmicutes bacterium]|nr:hypothetical protein [Bacillota bacterium]
MENELEFITLEQAGKEVFSKEFFEQFDSKTLAEFCIEVIKQQQQANVALKWMLGNNRMGDVALSENKRIVDEILKSRR